MQGELSKLAFMGKKYNFLIKQHVWRNTDSLIDTFMSIYYWIHDGEPENIFFRNMQMKLKSVSIRNNSCRLVTPLGLCNCGRPNDVECKCSIVKQLKYLTKFSITVSTFCRKDQYWPFWNEMQNYSAANKSYRFPDHNEWFFPLITFISFFAKGDIVCVKLFLLEGLRNESEKRFFTLPWPS